MSNQRFEDVVGILKSRVMLEDIDRGLKSRANPSDQEKEKMLLMRINCLPKDLHALIGEFSVAVKVHTELVKYFYLKTWIDENTNRIMGLIDGWSKEQVGIVLTKILNFESQQVGNAFLKGNFCYKTYTANEMRLYIKNYINHISKPRISYFISMYIFSERIDKSKLIQVYGAYKAVEEYDTRLKMKKSKKSKR